MIVISRKFMGGSSKRGEFWWDIEILLEGTIASEEELGAFAHIDARRSGFVASPGGPVWIQGPEIRVARAA